MANCNIIRSNNKVVYTEAPNGQRSILFDALTTKLGSKEEALKFWLASKTPKFLNNVAYPKLTQHRVDLLNRLKTATFKANDITLNVDGRKVNVNLNDISFTNVKRIGFNTVSAYVKPAGAKDTAIPKEGFEIVISPKNEEDLVRVNRYLFGLNEEQAIAAATTMDIIIDSMAKTANITKSEMYDKIGFGKSTAAELKGTNALFQGSGVFKSTAQEGLNKLPDGKRNAAQWVKAISEKGGKGTSQELEWLGLEDFLEEYQTENKVKSVSKDIVENYLEDNKIVIKGVTKYTPSEEDIDMFLEDEMGQGFTSREEARDYLEQDEDRPQYEKWTLPKGENYREILLTIPGGNTLLNKLAKELKAEGYVMASDAVYPKTIAGYADVNNYPQGVEISSLPTAAKTIAERMNKERGKKEYKSSHWDEKNILAHIRMNERTLPNGERVLFIEEIQSDLSQTILKEKKGAVEILDNNFNSTLETLISKGVIKKEC